jgi:hypothetical protein
MPALHHAPPLPVALLTGVPRPVAQSLKFRGRLHPVLAASPKGIETRCDAHHVSTAGRIVRHSNLAKYLQQEPA